MSLPRIAIATGDPAGIGPEIALKAALDRRVTALCRPLLVGDPAAVELHAEASGLTPRFNVVAKAGDADWSNGAVNLLDASEQLPRLRPHGLPADRAQDFDASGRGARRRGSRCSPTRPRLRPA